MDNQVKLIETFYRAFQNKDWKGMQACYHPEVRFSDPVFTDLFGTHAKAMWHMLVDASTDLTISFSGIQSDSNHGLCQWEAIYTFSRTGKRVHNIIEAKFEFKDGLIFVHHDSFDLWKWSRMAMGLSGILLGWTSFFKNKIRGIAKINLTKFINKHPEYE